MSGASNKETTTSMGDLFRQRRAKSTATAAAARTPNQQQSAGRQQQTSPPSPPSGGKAKSFAEIQAEQEKEQQQQQRGGGGGGRGERGSRAKNNTSRGGGGGGGGNRRQNQQPPHLSYPIEQGRICSLKESFGFIYCADRVEEVFFHYSEMIGVDNSKNSGSSFDESALIDLCVEFRIGPSVRDPNKNQAYQVKPLKNTEIQWEIPAHDGKRVRGLVERRSRGGVDARGSNNSANAGNVEGTIRLLKETQGNDEDAVATADGPLIRFRASDVSSSAERSTGVAAPSLSRGDLVECLVVLERRTGHEFAKDITLLLSERERIKQEEESKLLSSAREEHGVVTSLKGEYGFLRSNSRREEVYFHYSSIDLDADGAVSDGDDMILKEGQDMKFLVVEEGGDDTPASAGAQHRPKRISARRVSMQKRGSVKFHEHLYSGVTGTVLEVPHCVDSSHKLEEHGRILLSSPLVVKRYVAGVLEPGTMAVREIHLSPQDSPGGRFSYHGGESVGLWIQVGDTLLFDVVQDYSDGACRAVGTTYLEPPAESETVAKPGLTGNSTLVDEEEKAIIAAAATSGSSDGGLGKSDEEIIPAVRLIFATLAGRAEGTVGALKEGYGFIHFAERPVDVHFKLYQLLPDALQDDLRRNMGLPNVDNNGQALRLELGTQVQFDISLHGKIHPGTSRSRSGKQKQQERENLKAQRILLLPPQTFKEFEVIATAVKGHVSKKDANQPATGNIELETAVQQMSLEKHHPLTVKMIKDYVHKKDASPSTARPIVYHDIQSTKEDEVVLNLVEAFGEGKVTTSYVPFLIDPSHPGCLCIQHVSKPDAECNENIDDSRDIVCEDFAVDNVSDDCITEGGPENKGNPKMAKKKQVKQKVFKSVRFDIQSFSDELIQDSPPGLDDIVEMVIVQSRRTGQMHVENLKILERRSRVTETNEAAEVTETIGPAIGIVREIVPARNFGFISVVDETSATIESIFFSLKQGDGKGGSAEKQGPKFKKGDAVSFKITSEKNGKRVATNIAFLPKGILATKTEQNACRGIILQQPAHTSLKNTPIRKASAQGVQNKSEGGRWDSGEEDRKPKESLQELGCILLVDDPSGMFKKSCSNDETTASSGVQKAADGPSDLISNHIRYKNGALAIVGAGSCNAGDESTNPRRGDLVSFVRSKKGTGVRDIRIISRESARRIRGYLEHIQLDPDSDCKGTAKFVPESDKEHTYTVNLSEVVSCDPAILKDKEAIEAILHENRLHGIARTVDLFVETKLGVGHRERPKLNLIVKKDRGGTIMAQSMMAKGPDGTTGFAPSWTTRTSRFDVIEAKNMEDGNASPTMLSVEAPEFTPVGL
jgi:cold shock CspA family protein